VPLLNWRFGLIRMTLWSIEGGACARFVERSYPHKSYHHHPNHSIWIWEW
jgi:hypothetical protein